MGQFSKLVHGGVVDALEIARVREVILFEEPALRERLVRFGALLTLASAIATFGLYGDSAAAVIGAMIVAPLMLPIMGLAFAISIGDLRAIRSSLLVGVGGIATAIGVGYLIALLMPSSFDPTNVGQIMVRTTPRLIDLLAALATGLAGAFAIGRRDVSDTLPGVAIAISLVPPLANAGILLGAGRHDLAHGSLLLFLTNYVAILLTGSLVFGLMGFPAAALSGATPRARHLAITTVLLMIALIAVPLGLASRGVIRDNLVESRVTEAARSWTAGTGYRLISVTTSDDTVSVVVTGTGEIPVQGGLESQLDGQIYGTRVRVTAIPSQIIEFATR